MRAMPTLVVLAALALGSCGGGATDATDSAAPSPQAGVAPETTPSLEQAPTSSADSTPTSPAVTALSADTVVPVTATFDLPDCPDAPRGAVADKARQRFWLCADGVAITDERPMTTASAGYGLPPVGTYDVFARDAAAFGIHGEALERFVAFYTTSRGNRIAFHEVVSQDPSTVGDLDQRGASSGCFRILEDDSYQVWDYLQVGDPVVINSN